MEPFKLSYKIYEVPVYETATYGETFFVRYVDLFAKLAVYGSLLLLVLGFAYNLVIRFKGNKR